MSKNYQELIERLRDLSGRAEFVSLTYTTKETGERSRYVLIAGATYRKQVERSLLALAMLKPTAITIEQKIAFAELQASFELTLKSIELGQYNPDYTKPHSYVHISQGLKYNIANRTIQVSGPIRSKKVLEPGIEKHVNHGRIALAKIQFKKELPIGKWREFITAPENLELARLQGTELILTLL